MLGNFRGGVNNVHLTLSISLGITMSGFKLLLKLIHILMVLLISVFPFAAVSAETCGEECHVMKPYEDEAHQNEDLLVFSHHVDWELSCKDCHERSEKEIAHEKAVFKSGDYEKPLYHREYKNELCLECHDNYEGLIARTNYFEDVGKINPHRIHIGSKDCNSCHRIHRRSRFSCSECHRSDWKQVLPSSWQIAK